MKQQPNWEFESLPLRHVVLLSGNFYPERRTEPKSPANGGHSNALVHRELDPNWRKAGKAVCWGHFHQFRSSDLCTAVGHRGGGVSLTRELSDEFISDGHHLSAEIANLDLQMRRSAHHVHFNSTFRKGSVRQPTILC